MTRSLFPRSQRGRAWLYLVICKDGLMKVGRTQQPRDRLQTHRRHYGANLLRCHLFTPLPVQGAITAERSLLRKFGREGRRAGGREEFRGVSQGNALLWCRYAVVYARQWHQARQVDTPEAWAEFSRDYVASLQHANDTGAHWREGSLPFDAKAHGVDEAALLASARRTIEANVKAAERAEG